MKKIITNTLLILLLGTSLFGQSTNLTPELLWDMGRVSLEDVSPDGKNIVYGVRYYDVKTNKGSTDIYLLTSNGGVLTRLTDSPESEGNVRFTADGKRIGYLKNGFLYEMDLTTKKERAVSEVSMNGFEYAPNGKRILYIQDVKYDLTVNEKYADLPLADARIMDDLMYRHWKGWHDFHYSNVHWANYKDGNLSPEHVNIMGEPFDSPLNPFGGMEQITFSPDGEFIAYTCKKLKGKEYTTSTNSDVYLYEIETGKTTNLSKGMMGYDMDPVFSPDGKAIVWNSMEREGYEADRNRIFMMNMKTGTKEELTKGLDRNCNSPQWSADGKMLYFSSPEKGTYQLYSMNVATKKVLQITKGQHNYYGFVPNGDHIIASKASMSMPHELYRVDLVSGKDRQLTKINTDLLAKINMGEVKERWVKTTDGKDMLVWMIYPPNFDPNKKYPALLYCQGGPQSTVSQFWSYRWNFQMMAANDYIVVAPNRRGLPSFGTEWNEQISGDWGGQAQQDLLSAIDDAKQEPYIDENRLGAVGASYGGYSVYWLAGNHNKRFKSFISHCGLFNLESWYGTTEEMFFANWDLKGSYWDKNKSKTWSTDSPHRYVGNWDTPMLVIHGGKDFRVPESEGMQAFQAAQLQGIPSRFLYFPNEGHWVQKPQNGILWQRVFFEWLDKSLKTDAP